MTTRILKYCIPLLTGIAAIGACSKSPEDNIPAGMPGTGFTVTLHAEGIGSRTVADDSVLGEVYGYRFADRSSRRDTARRKQRRRPLHLPPVGSRWRNTVRSQRPRRDIRPNGTGRVFTGGVHLRRSRARVVGRRIPADDRAHRARRDTSGFGCRTNETQRRTHRPHLA